MTNERCLCGSPMCSRCAYPAEYSALKRDFPDDTEAIMASVHAERAAYFGYYATARAELRHARERLGGKR